MDSISFDDFLKVDMRAGTVLSAEAVPKSKKLLKLSISLGTEIGIRTVLAGIGPTYTAEMMVGRQVAVVVNLAPREIMGIPSHGMLLAGKSPDGNVSLVIPAGVAEGERLG